MHTHTRNVFGKMRRGLLCAALMLLATATLKAQCPPPNSTITNYTFSTGVGTSSDWLTPANTYSSMTSGDDAASSLSNLGFTFTFEGTPYTQFSVNTNGQLRLGSTVISYSPYSQPLNASNVTSNYPKIIGIGADLYGTTLTYGVSGSAPNRIGVFTYYGYRLGYSGNPFYFKVYLYEATGEIKMIYNSSPATPPDNYQIGIVGANSSNVVTVNPSSHTKSNGANANTYSTWPGQYRYYSFLPPVLSCPGIHNLAVAGSTVTWIECGSATQWEIEYGPQGFTLGNGTRQTVNTNPTYTLTGLTAGNVYDVYVRSVCGPNDQSAWKKTSLLYGVTFCGGNGTQANPYLICTEQDLRDLASYVNRGVSFSGIYFRLANNLTLTQTFIPIGSTHGTPFEGTFYGSNHTISSLVMNGTTSTLRGLFGYCNGAYIDSLTVEGNVAGGDTTGAIVGKAVNSTIRHCLNNAYVTGAYRFHGGIAGVLINSRVEYCTNNAIITGAAYYKGGIAGGAYDGSVIRYCVNNEIINNGSAYYTGGIVGYMNSPSTSNRTSIHHCINKGEVRGYYYTGGIAGETYNYGTIDTCTNLGNVYGSYSYTGGIAGYGYYGTVIRRCSNRATVYSNSGSYTGGIIGYMYSTSGSYGYLEYCVNAGPVTGGSSYVGGIGGYVYYYNYVRYCSNSADVTNTSTSSYTGGICGYGGTYVYIQYCLNGGLVTSNGSYVGGITGYGYSTSYVTNNLNVNNVKGGATGTYIAAIAGSGSVNTSNNYWDMQMCPTSILYGTTASSTQNKTTQQLLGSAGAALLSTTYFNSPNADMYPMPKGISDSIGCKLAATKVHLSNLQNVGAVDTNFLVGTQNNVYWLSANPTLVSIAGANATVNPSYASLVRLSGITADSLVKHVDVYVLSMPTFCGGSGTQVDPYLICNPATLDSLADLVNMGISCQGIYFKVVRDLDMSGFNPWNPIGATAGTPFSGHFDGNNKVISNVTINNTTQYQGLFGYVLGTSANDRAEVHHVILRGSITGGNYTGGIVGYANYAKLHNLTNYANVASTSYSYHGGIAGYAYYNCTFDSCVNHGTVQGSSYTGGITGYGYYYDTITNCLNTGDVSSNSGYIAGIIGYKYYYGVIRNTENQGDVSGSYYVGGIAGYDYYYQLITNCVNRGDINATSYDVGGIVGYFYTGMSTLTSVYEIRNCENYGSVSGTYYIGGIAGYGYYCRARFCNNYGDVNATSYATGGIIGYCYYYGLVSGCNNYGDITSTYVSSTIASTPYGTGGIVGCFSYGTTVSGIYTIDSCNNYGDISAASYMAGGIVGESYYYSGSTRKCNNYGNVHGTCYVGGITGFHQGSYNTSTSYAPYIISCANAGSVSGTDYIGGIVGRIGYTSYGYNAYTQECANIGSVSGTNYVGGICGYNYGYSGYPSYVRGCLNAGAVNASNYAGGICGYTNSSSYAYTQYNINAGYVKCSGTYKGGIDGYSNAPTSCYFDSLMCPMPNWYYNNNNATYARRTSYLTSGSFNPSATYFTAEAGMYPRPTTLRNNTIAILAATPVFLDETNPTNHVDNVNSCFSVGTLYNVNWHSTNNAVANITGNVGVPLLVDTVTAIAVKDSIAKVVPLNITALPQISTTFTYNPAVLNDTTGRSISIRPATNQYSNGCTFFSNSLPRGLSLNPSTGEISGVIYDELHDTIEVRAVCSGCFIAQALIPYNIYPEAPCMYDSLGLPAGYTWYYDSTLRYPVANNTVYADQRPMWVYTSMGGRLQHYLIQPKPVPTAHIYGDTTICTGESARLMIVFNGTAPYYYRISGDTQDRISNSDTAYITVSPSASTYYHLTYLRFEVCEAVPGNLTGRALVNICGETNLCNGDSVVFTSGSWFTNSSYTNPVQGNVAHPTTTTMYYNRTDGSSLRAVVYPRPTCTIPTGSDSICNGACINLRVTFTGTAPFHYRLTGDTVDRVCNSNSETLRLCPRGSIVYRVLYVSDVYCEGDYQDRNGVYDVNVCAMPIICQGDTVVLASNRVWYYDRYYQNPVGDTIVTPTTTTTYYTPAVYLDDSVDFSYTGNVQMFVVPYGIDSVKLKVWGAQGGGSVYHNSTGGKGGYSEGVRAVSYGDTLYVYVGGKGNQGAYSVNGGWNGGGGITSTYSYYDGSSSHHGSGGGATDISTVGGNCTMDSYNRYVRSAASYAGRIIVAGGGGGSELGGGTAGGGTSGEGTNAGTQSAAGAAAINSAGSWVTLYPGGLGYGNSTTAGHTNHAMGSAGGGGYYGGGCYAENTSSGTSIRGFGGSGYIGGVNNGVTIVGTSSFKSPLGTNETGHSGHGYARIIYRSSSIVADSTSYTVRVNPHATATIHGVDTTCDSTPARVQVTFTGTAPFVYRVSGDTTDRISYNYTQTLYLTPDTLSTYRITMLRDANCTSGRAQFAGIGIVYRCGQIVVCEGDSVSLPQGYYWYSDRNLTRRLYITDILPRRTVTYYGVPVRGGNTYELTIVMKPHPTARIVSGNTTICNGDSAYLRIVFSGTAPYIYRITGDVANRMAWYDTAVIAVCPSQTSRYNITMLYDTLCSGILPMPEYEVTVEVCGQRLVCTGDTVHLPSGVWFYDSLCTRPVPASNIVTIDSSMTFYLAGELAYDFYYTGSTQYFQVPASCYALKLEVWGAQGGGQHTYNNSNQGVAGNGGYSVGTITNPTGITELYVNVGQEGDASPASSDGIARGGWNGGGTTWSSGSSEPSGGGGGATDISARGTAGSTAWNTPDHLYSRIIVAGGGGGGGEDSGDQGGCGGGVNGGANNYNSVPASTQTSAGTGGVFGSGASAPNDGGAGGGGWYGGGTVGGSQAIPTSYTGSDCNGGAGGSGYVYTAATASNYPSGCLLNSNYYLSNAQTMEGCSTIPDIANGTENGHTGDGHARITVYSTGTYTVIADRRPTGTISVYDTACGNNGVYLHLHFTGYAPFTYRITGDTADRISYSTHDSVYVQPELIQAFRITKLYDNHCTALPLDYAGLATVEVCRQTMLCHGDTLFLDSTRNWFSDPLMLNPISRVQVPDSTTVYYTNTVRTHTAVVNEHPTATILTPDTAICGGSVCLRIHFNGTAPFTYRITGDSTDRISYFNDDVVCITPTNTGVYGITKLDDVYCTGDPSTFVRTMVVTVCDQMIVCAGDTVILPSGTQWYYDAALRRPVPNNIANPTVTTNYYMESTTDFSYTGNVQKYVVPNGVTQLDLQVWGAEGGKGSYSSSTSLYAGGKGGYSEGTMPVNSGDTLYVYVGGRGQDATGATTNYTLSGGYNGGGDAAHNYSGTYQGGSGGGGTDIRVNSTALGARAIVAGGGGGGAYSYVGGYGGGTTGGAGSNTGAVTYYGQGGTQSGGGAATTGGSYAYGSGTYDVNGQAGSFGQGGNGGTGSSACGGGAGGGGWFGGSGGKSGYYTTCYPGGGGSGFVYTSANANCTLPSSYYLTNASTTAGNATFESVSGGTETGHEGNGYARIHGAAVYTVVVNTTPKATIATGTTRICDSASHNAVNITINFTGTAPFTYRVTGDVVDRVTNNGSETITIYPTVSGTYQVTYLKDYYCESLPIDLQGVRTVLVCDQPIICSEDQATLPAGTWYEDVLLTRPVGGNVVHPSMTTTYYDQDTNTFTVTVRPRPTAVISGRASVCDPQDSAALTIRFTGTLPITYRLSGERFNRTATNYVETINVHPRRTTTYTITQVSDQFCVGRAIDLVGLAVISVCDSVTICPGQQVTLPAGTWFYDSLMTAPVGGNVVYPAATTTYYRMLSGGYDTNFAYTGSVQSYTVPLGVDSVFLQVWGGQGGDGGPTNLGGKGGYSEGKMAVTAGDVLHVYVGGAGQGTNSTSSVSGLTIGGWNGGGNGYQGTTPRSAGGGGTDIRVNNQSLYARVIVAGGGGGNIYFSGNTYVAGCGGGTTGGNGTTAASTGGTQTSAGTNPSAYSNFTNAAFGTGATATTTGSTVCGGGGGWYGGGDGNSASGGSGYVYTAATASNYPAGCLLTSAYYLTDARTISGCSQFVAPDSTLETGHSGNGYARIKALGRGGVDSYTVNVYPQPMATIYGGDTICNGQTARLVINFTGVAPFIYRLNGETINRSCNGNTDTIYVSPTVSTAYRVSMMYDQYCEARLVDLQGVANVIVCDQPVICEGQAVQLDPNRVWYLDHMLTYPLPSASVTPTQTTTYYSAEGSYTVTVKPRPRATINTQVLDICDSQTVSVVINFTGTPPFVYRLTGDTADRVCNNNMEILTFMPMGSHIYRMVMLYDALCDGTFLDMSGSVKVNYCGQKEICGGEVVVLDPDSRWYLDSACTRPVPSNSVMPSTTTTYYRHLGDTIVDFSYVCDSGRVFVVPRGVDTVFIQAWGAEGGLTRYSSNTYTWYGGRGGYSEGKLPVTPGDILYIHTGGKGGDGATGSTGSALGGCNGGGNSSANTTSSYFYGGGGGGGTDVRVNSNSIYARVIVAGGGGGAAYGATNGDICGGAGGGTAGLQGTAQSSYLTRRGSPGTQTAGGAAGTYTTGNGTAGAFWQGGTGGAGNASGGGGGGGWYGGGGGNYGSASAGSGAGGSGYVWTAATAANYPAGGLLTPNYYMVDARTVAGNQTIYEPDSTTETGHIGDGYVRISYPRDVVDSFTVIVHRGYSETFYDTIGYGESYNLCGVSYTRPGTYIANLYTVDGCDSTLILNLFMLDSLHRDTTIAICAFQTLDFRGTIYDSTGVYINRKHYEQACDTTYTIHLTVKDTAFNYIDTVICSNDTIFVGDTMFNQTGFYRQYLQTELGCDSMVVLNLVVQDTIWDIRDSLACYETVVDFYGNQYDHTQPGTYTYVTRTVHGCDSIIILNLRFRPRIDTIIYDTFCENSRYFFNEEYRNASGIYYDTLPSVLCGGCDSIIELHLTRLLYPVVTLTDSGAYCKNDSLLLVVTTDANSIRWETYPVDTSMNRFRNQAQIRVAPKVHTFYTVTVDHYPHNCVSTAQIYVKPPDTLKAVMRANPSIVDRPNTQIEFTDVSVGSVVANKWIFDDMVRENSQSVYYTTAPDDDSIRVILIVFDTNTCSDTTDVIIPIRRGDIWVPNAFTPDNHDGNADNETFKVSGLNVLDFEIHVYSRAGLLMYESTDINGTWDGTRDGKRCAPGSYVYIIKYRLASHPERLETKTGSILLIR